MKAYKNLSGKESICSYELGEKKIRIKLHSHKEFIYDAEVTGMAHVDKMQLLASQGFGLYDYITENGSELRAIPLD